jgi:hypothetical protein
MTIPAMPPVMLRMTASARNWSSTWSRQALVKRFQNSNHMGPSKVPQSAGRSLKFRLSGFMESVV